MSFTAMAGAAMVFAPTFAQAQMIEVAAGDEVEITENLTGDPAVLYTYGGAGGDVVVRSGVTIEGTGNYQEFNFPNGEISFTDGRGAVNFEQGSGGGSLTIEEGATAIGTNYGVTTTDGRWVWDANAAQWNFEQRISDPTAEANITINNAGEIIGQADDGLRLFNHATVVNTGTIIGARDVAPHDDANIPGSIGDGISSAIQGLQNFEDAPEDGHTLRVDNSGTIIGRRMGIIASAGAVINNSGTIHGESSGVLMQTSSWFGGPGVVIIPYIANRLTNSGSITADFQNGVNVQSWSRTTGTPYDLTEIDPEDYDFFDTFDHATADAVLINSGLIETFAESGGATTGVVVDPVTGEQIPVEGASLFYAARMGSVNGYILNTEDGMIRALNGANALRLAANAGNEDESLHGTIILDNQGTIIGGVIGANTYEDENGNIVDIPGQELIRNDGLIDGDVALGGGNDVFWLDANGTVTGTIDLGLGDDLMIWNTMASVGANVTGGEGSNTLALILGGSEFDAARVFNFDTVLTFGSGDLGNIDLSLVPEIQVNAGATLNIGSTGFSGVAFINPGGELVGVGEVEAIVVYGSAQLAPGNSIGTITVTGDVDLSAAPDVVYNVEVAPAGSDQILADGNVMLAGGTVNVTGENGVDLAPGSAPDSYVILAGALGLTGEFDTLTDTLRFYDVNLVYTATEVVLEMDPVGADFIATAATDNQLGVGTVLYNGLLTADGDFLDAMKESFPGLSAADVQTGLDALSGPAHAWAPVAASQTGVQISRVVGRSPMLANGDRNLWVGGLQGSLDIDSANGAVGAEMDSQGAVFGYDIGLNGATFGVFTGWATTEGDDEVGGALDADGFFLGLRAAAALGGGFSINAQGGVMRQEADVVREIEVGGLNRTANSDYAIDGVFFGAEIAWERDFGGLTGGLFASLDGGSYESEDFAETGAGSLSLMSNGSDFARASYRIGARVSSDFGMVRPHAEAGLQMEDGQRSETVSHTFAGLPGAFGVTGPAVEADAPFVSLGADFGFSDTVKATVAYDGLFGDTSEGHSFMARLSIAF